MGLTKHRYEVDGINCNTGEKFCGTCIVEDITDVIPMFREKMYSVHNIFDRGQCNADSEIGIEFTRRSPLYPEYEESKTETYVAKEMYKLFAKYDMKNFSVVRKQILKNLPVEYFSNKTENEKYSIVSID